MDKDYATLRLGGEDAAARWIGISPQVYKEWPARLHRIMADRVYAAVLRRETAKALGLNHRQFFADPRGEILIESMIERISIAAVVANLMDRAPPEYVRNEPYCCTTIATGSKRRKRGKDEEGQIAGVS